MTTAQFSVFFAVLSLGCWAATITVVIAAIGQRLRPASGAADVIDAVGPYALWLAWLVAAVTMAGSLYYSLGAHFSPCELCWYQRICEYPLALILLVAAIRRDRQVWCYVVPVAAIGVVIAAYQSQLQAFPDQQTFCSSFNPCTTRYVWEFGFVSLPLMDLAALLFVITMMFVARTAEGMSREGDELTTAADDHDETEPEEAL